MRITVSIVEILSAAILCYNSLPAAVVFIPWLPVSLYLFKRKQEEKRAEKMEKEFADVLSCIGSALEAGYSVENAVREAKNDISVNEGSGTCIVPELERMISMLNSGSSAEAAFAGMAKRNSLPLMQSFAEMFTISKRTGGNILAIIRSCIKEIRKQDELKREHQEAMAATKYEFEIMKLVPVGVLVYLRIFSPDLTEALYGNMFGIIFMSVILCVYLIMWVWGEHIIKSET